MELYSLHGAYPTALPSRLRLPDGSTRTDPSTFTAAEITAAGWQAAPDKPNPTRFQVVEWGGADWVVRDKTQEELDRDHGRLVHGVKAEAYRRIIAICPEWKQRNLTARAAQLAKKGEANWTQDEAAEWAAGEAIWDQIATIRTKSGVIEAMDPIPEDYTADTYWE
jgi:hypothetical protein